MAESVNLVKSSLTSATNFPTNVMLMFEPTCDILKSIATVKTEPRVSPVPFAPAFFSGLFALFCATPEFFLFSCCTYSLIFPLVSLGPRGRLVRPFIVISFLWNFSPCPTLFLLTLLVFLFSYPPIFIFSRWAKSPRLSSPLRWLQENSSGK